MNNFLTPEERKEIQEYFDTVEAYSKNLDKVYKEFEGTDFIPRYTFYYEKALEEVEKIQDKTTDEPLFRKRFLQFTNADGTVETKQYKGNEELFNQPGWVFVIRPEFQKYETDNTSYFTIFKEPLELYNTIVKPYYEKGLGIELPLATDQYYNRYNDYITLIEDPQPAKIQEKANTLKKLIENHKIASSKQFIEEYLQEVISIGQIQFSNALIIKTLLYWGGVDKWQDLSGLFTQELFTIFDSELSKLVPRNELGYLFNAKFGSALIHHSQTTGGGNWTSDSIKLLRELKQTYSAFDQTKVDTFLANKGLLELIEEDELDAIQLQTDVETLYNKIGTIGESLEQYVKDILDDEDKAYDDFINLSEPEKGNVITAAKANNILLLNFLIEEDPRVLTIRNNVKFLKRKEATRVNADFYSPTYYNDWLAPLEKLTISQGSFVSVEDQIEVIKTKLTVEKLLENDINIILADIDKILDVLILEVEPPINTFYKTIELVTILVNKEKRELLFETLDISLDTPLDLPFSEELLLQFLAVIQDEKGSIDQLILSLQALKKDLIKDTVEDLLKVAVEKEVKTNAGTVDSIIDKANSLKKELQLLCDNIIRTEDRPLTDFLNTVSREASSIYSYIFDSPKFKEVYTLHSNSVIHNYTFLAKQNVPINSITVDSSSYGFKFNSVLVLATRYYKRLCGNSLRLGDNISLRANIFIQALRDIKIAISDQKLADFNKSLLYAIHQIELDLFPDASLYFTAIEIFDVNDSNNKRKADNSLYMPKTNQYKFDEIASLKFNSYKIIELLIDIHKDLKKLKFAPNKESLEKEIQEEVKDNYDITKKLEEANKKRKERKALDVPKENWGIRISPAQASNRVNIQTPNLAEDASKEDKVNTQTFTKESAKFGNTWYMTLLPTMTSNLPVTGGSQAPGAQPGLNFRIINSLVKHKIPGFGPVYQPMGIDTINCTIVGCFTGADGLSKYEVGSVESFTENRATISPELLRINTTRNGVGNAGARFKEYVTVYDSFENYQSFYNEVIQANKEIEVEINLKRNTTVLSKGAEGIFRNSITGNPTFRGYIKRFDSYYVREDRMWYIMDVQLTANSLVETKCVNLTNIIEEAVKDINIQQTQSSSFEVLKDCLFEKTTTDNTGFPPKRTRNKKDLLQRFNGLTIRNKDNKQRYLSISQEGYGLIYEDLSKNETKDTFNLIGENPLLPIKVFRELNKDEWDIDPSGRYVIKMALITRFKTRLDHLAIKKDEDLTTDERKELQAQSSRQTFVGKELNLSRGILGDPVLTAKNRKRGINLDRFRATIRYNSSTGNLAETGDVADEYDILKALSPKNMLDKGISNYKPLYEFINSLETLNVIEFNVSERIETCLKNDKELLAKRSEKSTGRFNSGNKVTPEPAPVVAEVLPITKAEVLNLVRERILENYFKSEYSPTFSSTIKYSTQLLTESQVKLTNLSLKISNFVVLEESQNKNKNIFQVTFTNKLSSIYYPSVIDGKVVRTDAGSTFIIFIDNPKSGKRVLLDIKTKKDYDLAKTKEKNLPVDVKTKKAQASPNNKT